jgi:hypothetical protein
VSHTIDRIGQRYGKLTVVARAPGRAPSGNAIWLCDCDCGTQGHIVSGNTIHKMKTCGCSRKRWPLIKKENLTQARLKQVLNYKPEIGEFSWLISKSPNAQIGSRAGNIDQKGYCIIGIDGKMYRAHRLAWAHVHGYFPKELDHINRIRSDNRLANLRPATRSQASANTKVKINNRAGLKGVRRQRGRWQARILYHGKYVHLGTFDTSVEAHAAYCYAAKRLFGEFFCDGKN